MKRLFWLLLMVPVLLAACSPAAQHDGAATAELQSRIDSLQQSLAMSHPTPGLIHTVFFWKKASVTDEQWADFTTGIRMLGDISTVQSIFIGPHADTEARDVVDHSYGLALIVHFANQADQDAYQTDPIHLAFIDRYEALWEQVKVYDTQVLGTTE